MKSFLKYWLPLLTWLVVIFVGSTSIMSAAQTSRYIVPFLLWLKPGMSPHAIWIILITIRKCAHVIEYAVLALLLWRALRSIPTLQTNSLMQNCDTRMTGEVHKRFHGQRRNWSLLQKLHSITSAVVACIVMYCETTPALQAASQNATVARNSEQLSRAAVIS